MRRALRAAPPHGRLAYRGARVETHEKNLFWKKRNRNREWRMVRVRVDRTSHLRTSVTTPVTDEDDVDVGENLQRCGPTWKGHAERLNFFTFSYFNFHIFISIII